MRRSITKLHVMIISGCLEVSVTLTIRRQKEINLHQEVIDVCLWVIRTAKKAGDCLIWRSMNLLYQEMYFL